MIFFCFEFIKKIYFAEHEKLAQEIFNIESLRKRVIYWQYFQYVLQFSEEKVEPQCKESIVTLKLSAEAYESFTVEIGNFPFGNIQYYGCENILKTYTITMDSEKLNIQNIDRS